MKIKPILIITIILALGTTSAWGMDWRKHNLFYQENGYEYLVSSELDDRGIREFGPYGGHNLFDRNPATCWAEGVPGPGKGEKLFITVPQGDRTIHILNGYHKSKTLFMKNNRVKELSLTMYVAVFRPDLVSEIFLGYDIVPYNVIKRVTLPDSMQPQAIPFPWDWHDLEKFMDKAYADNPNTGQLEDIPQDMRKRYLLRLEIVDVYPGNKYNDTCISEFWMSK